MVFCLDELVTGGHFGSFRSKRLFGECFRVSGFLFIKITSFSFTILLCSSCSDLSERLSSSFSNTTHSNCFFVT